VAAALKLHEESGQQADSVLAMILSLSCQISAASKFPHVSEKTQKNTKLVTNAAKHMMKRQLHHITLQQSEIAVRLYSIAETKRHSSKAYIYLTHHAHHHHCRLSSPKRHKDYTPLSIQYNIQ
jgi:hypothetical protein